MTLNTGWTTKEETILKDLWGQGYSASRVGKLLGRTRNSVISKVHRMNLSGHGPNIKRSTRKKVLKSTRNKTKGIKDKVYYIPISSEKPINQEPFQAGSHTPVPLDYLTTSSCRWPLEDKNGKHLGYCGCKKTGLAYCDYHAAIAYPALSNLMQEQEEVA